MMEEILHPCLMLELPYCLLHSNASILLILCMYWPSPSGFKVTVQPEPKSLPTPGLV